MIVIITTALAHAADPLTSAPAQIIGQKESGYRDLSRQSPSHTQPAADGAMADTGISSIPNACYVEKVNKTFFTYLSKTQTTNDKPNLLIMIAYYDHNTKMVPQPHVLIKTKDAHHQPALTLDQDGYLWVFVGSDNTNEPANILKSTKPYDINSFDLAAKSTFADPQCWYLENNGFLLIHSRNQEGCRQLYSTSSPDGLNWSQPIPLAAIEQGHQALSWKHKNTIALAFNTNINKNGQNTPTNVYYMETSDLGKNWRNVRKQKIEIPLKTVDNPALIRDYASQDWSIYLKDLNIDRFGFPIILYIMKKNIDSPNRKMSCIWNTARWYGRDWEFAGQIRSNNVLDTGCLNIDENRNCRLIAPTQTGPQPDQGGGEIIMWTTDDQGRSWLKKTITQNSKFNHNYVRRPLDAHDPFDTFWSDGQAGQSDTSKLYFADKDGNAFILPTKMIQEFEKPLPLDQPKIPTETKPVY